MRVLVLVLLASVIAWAMMGEEDVVRAIKDKVGVRNVEGYAADIRFAASESQVDPLLIAGVMYAESSGIKGSISSANARGLMQLSLGSAQDAARKLGLPECAVRAGETPGKFGRLREKTCRRPELCTWIAARWITR